MCWLVGVNNEGDDSPRLPGACRIREPVCLGLVSLTDVKNTFLVVQNS